MPVESDFGDDEREPAVAYAGPKSFVAWADEVFGTSYDFRVRGIDSATCQPCGNELLLAAGSPIDTGPELVAQASGSTAVPGEEVYAVRAQDVGPVGGQVKGRRIDVFGGGPVVNLGGGCGTGGTISVVGPAALGYPDFEIRVDGADPGALFALLNLTVPGLPPLECAAGCEWLPFADPPIAVLPLVGGSASVSFAIPCNEALDGASVQVQWTAAFTPPIPCPVILGPANASWTDILQVTLRP